MYYILTFLVGAAVGRFIGFIAFRRKIVGTLFINKKIGHYVEYNTQEIIDSLPKRKNIVLEVSSDLTK